MKADETIAISFNQDEPAPLFTTARFKKYFAGRPNFRLEDAKTAIYLNETTEVEFGFYWLRSKGLSDECCNVVVPAPRADFFFREAFPEIERFLRHVRAAQCRLWSGFPTGANNQRMEADE